MRFLSTEIKELLETHDYGYSVSVVRSFDSGSKIFPRIVIHQITDSTLSRSSTSENDALSVLAFQIDIYTKDGVNTSGNVVGRDEINDDIASQIDELMYEQYRMNRDEVTDFRGYGNDVLRRVMRYSCVIDPENYTYRSAPVTFGGYSYQNRF